MKKYYFIISLFVFNNLYAQQSKGFDWLVGNWKISNNRGFIIETWKKQNDSLYIGSSGFVKGKDTIPEENVELKKVVEDWFYISTVANQNNNKPVSFKIFGGY